MRPVSNQVLRKTNHTSMQLWNTKYLRVSQHINLSSIGGLQDTVNIIRQLLDRVLHLIQPIENRDPMQLTIAECKYTVALGDKSRAHVEPVVDGIGAEAVHQHQSTRVECSRLTVPVVEPSTIALDKSGGVGVSGDGFMNDGAWLTDWDRGCLDERQGDRG